MSEEKIIVTVKTDSDSIEFTASKGFVTAIQDIPCTDLQCLQDIQAFFDGFNAAEGG